VAVTPRLKKNLQDPHWENVYTSNVLKRESKARVPPGLKQQESDKLLPSLCVPRSVRKGIGKAKNQTLEVDSRRVTMSPDLLNEACQ